MFSAFFAGRVGRLIGIEASPSACQDFAANLDEFDNVELYEAPAEAVLPGLEVNPDVVIADPPRAGLDKRALEALLALRPASIAYVSCDPSTLGRDAARLDFWRVPAGPGHSIRPVPANLFHRKHFLF